MVTITARGSSDAWFKLSALNSTKPVINSPGNCPNGILVENGCFVQILGFEVTGGNSDCVGIGTDNWANHVKIEFCHTHHCGQSGISASNNCDYIQILYCEVNNNCNTGLADGSGISFWTMNWIDGSSGYHNVIENNMIYTNAETWTGTGYAGNTQHTDGNGIIIDTSATYNGNDNAGTNWTPPTYIAFNTIDNNGGRGIHVFQCNNVTAENNSLNNNPKDTDIAGSNGELSSIYSHDVTYRNNTVTNGQGRWYWFYNSSNIDQYNNDFIWN